MEKFNVKLTNLCRFDEWQLSATIHINFTSAFISLLLLFSFCNKNVLFCVENDNNKKKNLFSIQ